MQTTQRGTTQHAKISGVRLRAVGFQRRKRLMWFGVFKDDHIKGTGGEMVVKNRRVGRIQMIGGKRVRD